MITIQNCPICDSQELLPLLETTDFSVTQEQFQIRKCNKCGLGITTPRPADNELARYYVSPNYISHASRPRNLLDFVYSLARSQTVKWKETIVRNLTAGRTLLDYGCGTADFLHFCQTKGWITTGVEPSGQARKIASQKKSFPPIFPDIQFVESKFDIITLWHVLEHLPNLNATIGELKQHLNATGSLVIAVPNLNSWDSKYYVKHWAALDTPRHLWHFTTNSLTHLLKKHELTIKRIIPMKLDAYYVSLLSEKYRHNSKNTVHGMINALMNGIRSNAKATRTGEYSSLIYIIAS
jgi:2-polyprenyl-3-methyl-5-hydroxy-6-metoxy-1,4-benzoquinol methylase